MIQSIIHTSENYNSYIYDNHHRMSMLIHPELKKVHEKATDNDPYYEEKYRYLKRYGFFSESEINCFETVINESKVKESLSQTPQILFEVTDFCNLNCTYCALGEMYGAENRNKKNIDIHSGINLLKYIFDLKSRDKKHELFISFYGGEPLLNMSFIKQIIKEIHDLNSERRIDIGYSMTTNAVLIDKHIEFLVTNKFNVLVSLDGDEENNSYRILNKGGENSFKKIIDNMDMIQRDYPEYFNSNINFNAVLHNRNSVKYIYEFIYNRYRKIPKISELNNVGIKPAKRKVFENMYHNIRESEIEYNKEEDNLLPHNELVTYYELTNFLKYLSVNSYVSDIVSSLYHEDKYLPTSTCLPFSKKIFLTTNNKLLPCERIDYKYSLGELKGDISIDVNKIAEQYNFYYEHLKKVCQHCYVYRFCGLCMFHIKDLDKIDIKEFVCDHFHDQYAFRSKLNRIFSFLEKHPRDFFEILEDIVIIS